jgi:hypothetical protein
MTTDKIIQSFTDKNCINILEERCFKYLSPSLFNLTYRSVASKLRSHEKHLTLSIIIKNGNQQVGTYLELLVISL